MLTYAAASAAAAALMIASRRAADVRESEGVRASGTCSVGRHSAIGRGVGKNCTYALERQFVIRSSASTFFSTFHHFESGTIHILRGHSTATDTDCDRRMSLFIMLCTCIVVMRDQLPKMLTNNRITNLLLQINEQLYPVSSCLPLALSAIRHT